MVDGVILLGIASSMILNGTGNTRRGKMMTAVDRTKIRMQHSSGLAAELTPELLGPFSGGGKKDRRTSNIVLCSMLKWVYNARLFLRHEVLLRSQDANLHLSSQPSSTNPSSNRELFHFTWFLSSTVSVLSWPVRGRS